MLMINSWYSSNHQNSFVTLLPFVTLLRSLRSRVKAHVNDTGRHLSVQRRLGFLGGSGGSSLQVPNDYSMGWFVLFVIIVILDWITSFLRRRSGLKKIDHVIPCQSSHNWESREMVGFVLAGRRTKSYEYKSMIFVALVLWLMSQVF